MEFRKRGRVAGKEDLKNTIKPVEVKDTRIKVPSKADIERQELNEVAKKLHVNEAMLRKKLKVKSVYADKSKSGHLMYLDFFDDTGNIAHKGSILLTIVFTFVFLICLLSSISYLNYTFNGVHTTGTINMVLTDEVSVKTSGVMMTTPVTNAVVEFDGHYKLFDAHKLGLLGSLAKGQKVTIVYLPGMYKDAISSYTYGSLIFLCVWLVLTGGLWFLMIHEHLGYKNLHQNDEKIFQSMRREYIIRLYKKRKAEYEHKKAVELERRRKKEEYEKRYSKHE